MAPNYAEKRTFSSFNLSQNNVVICSTTAASYYFAYVTITPCKPFTWHRHILSEICPLKQDA